MITNYEKPQWSFYATWILLTSISIPIAFFLTLIVLRIITRIVGDVIYVNGVRHITEDYLWIYPFVPIVGLLTGRLQNGLLRRYLPRMGRWVLATAGGWLLGVLLIALPGRENLINEFLGLSLVFLLMGLSIGVGPMAASTAASGSCRLVDRGESTGLGIVGPDPGRQYAGPVQPGCYWTATRLCDCPDAGAVAESGSTD